MSSDPYIITTKDGPAPDQRDPGYDVWLERQSRRAVATLEEARHDAENIVIDALGVRDTMEASDDRFDARELPESGGTVGPLPDGTVIEVAPIILLDLAQAAGFHVCSRAGIDGYSDQQIIDAYNAKQGV